MKCFGCYKENVEGYCLQCRKKLFDGKRVPHILPFNAPDDETLQEYQEQTTRLSISGVQLKYSLRLDNKTLVLTDKEGQYILKPIPPSRIVVPDQAPENEHLTMQIAEQVFKLPTAANALIYFSDGQPAYITRRFDVQDNGSKHLQEDFAQLSGRSKRTHGEHFKYNGTYEDIGVLIKKYVAAYMPVSETFFRTVFFNYLCSNGDAHLKNFSLIQAASGDYVLTPAYDLMSTVLHTPGETDTALDLFEDDFNTAYYQVYGHHGYSDFMELAKRISIMETRARRIISEMIGHTDKVVAMVNGSFLADDVKAKYLSNYADKVKRIIVP
jgi:serine/threonine-protein kinase HipA